jgi:hypothetical protein
MTTRSTAMVVHMKPRDPATRPDHVHRRLAPAAERGARRDARASTQRRFKRAHTVEKAGFESQECAFDGGRRVPRVVSTYCATDFEMSFGT